MVSVALPVMSVMLSVPRKISSTNEEGDEGGDISASMDEGE